MKYLHTRITEVTYPARDHALLRFAAAAEDIPAVPGEFVMIRGDWGCHPVLPRAFSLVESGAHGAVLVKAIGPGTQLLESMKVDDELVVFGALGKGYRIDDSGLRPVLVAGGVGVAPLLFLARELAARGQRPLFLYGAGTEHDLPLADEIAEVAELIITTEDGSVGEQGLITAPLQRALQDGADSIVYTCGPNGMLKAVAGVSQSHNTPCQVALEAPMACGMGTCKGCAVPIPDGSFKYVCYDGPVFDAEVIYGAADE
ncbi:dihydroorotate dehydrogenase electron transfer subunit [Halieaceae bacterium IMCC14734]|uniref:Dihydroorotate dehydrogenase electron transfer subunit n=1 Tax=Candidatus Litorirhabdus singularis TaxID=2518993 RepID=A0ABT3TKB2_9GAMM|nr:dihydroorotate dehydrogenase electron transfer subunit [Candidatus Litorirhabdus singularis]MCX2982748.1 dihydroorotate dehydrogenase electron transfer subunit [Candidatus Litorirhabdus singularis]